MAIGKISAIRRQFAADMTTLGSVLSEKGFTRSPGTKMGIAPYKEATGEYRTGLDPDAKYIRFLAEEDKVTELAKINGWREIIKKSLGDNFFDNEGRSDFYKDMYHPDKAGTDMVCQKAFLGEGDNIFNLDDVFQLLQFAYLRVHPIFVARSYSDYQAGKCQDSVRYYVNDEDIETKLKYQDDMLIDKAIQAMRELTTSEKVKIARLMGLTISYEATEEIAYLELRKFLNADNHKSGDKLHNVKLFNRINSLSPETRQIRYLIDLAFSYNIYRSKTGRVYDGGNEIAESREALADELAKPKNQKMLDSLEERIKAIRQVEV